MRPYIRSTLMLFVAATTLGTLDARKSESPVQTTQPVQPTPQVTRNLTIYDKKSPLKINSVSIKGKAIANGKSFTEGDDWSKELTVEVSNTTGRTITFVQVSVIVGPMNEVPFVFFMQKGVNPLQDEDPPEARLRMLPGDYLSLRLDPGLIESVRALIERSKHAKSAQVRVRVELIGFSDGNVWMGTKEVKGNPDLQNQMRWILRFHKQYAKAAAKCLKAKRQAAHASGKRHSRCSNGSLGMGCVFAQ